MTDSLPTRMREAAQALREAAKRAHPEAAASWNNWTASYYSLHLLSERFDAEDRASAQRAAEVEELAREIGESVYGKFDALFDSTREELRATARKLIAAGWTKVTATTDEWQRQTSLDRPLRRAVADYDAVRNATDPIVAFNRFIKHWVPEVWHAHLLDTDENDGQLIRELLRGDQ